MAPLFFYQLFLSAFFGLLVNGQRHITSQHQLRPRYDFVIAGGGTSGLTLADRLSERLGNKTVLVIEYGKLEYAPGVFDPPQTIWGGSSPGAGRWAFSSLPNPQVNNKLASVSVGATVGGSSAINGMFFDRASRFDYDAWAQIQAGSADFDASPHKWDHQGLDRYFKKAITFTPPPSEVVEKYRYTWNISAYGGTTPIFSSYPPFLWGDFSVARTAWTEMGIWTNNECASGDKAGLCWTPISQHPLTARRSHAGVGHFANITGPRDNFDLLTSHQVVRLLYPSGIDFGPPIIEVRPVDDATDGKSVTGYFNVTANLEVILSAGAFNTPMILHRSGIGPAAVLQNYSIPVVLDLPGVGANLQDHSGASVSWNYTNPLPPSLSPLPSAMLNTTFAELATLAFNSTPATGPYTLAMSNSAIFVPLPNISITYPTITSQIRSMAYNNSFSSFLPADYTSSPSLYVGYKFQLLAIADLLDNPSAPSLESGFATGTACNAINLHPLSRGTVKLDRANPLAQPVLDYRTGSNPVDFDVYKAHVRYLRRMVGTPTLRQYSGVEIGPGQKVADDEELLEQYVKDKMTFSFMHPCCTAAMMPRNGGGVVGPDLRLYGATGLRVVDMSVLPMLPGSHLSWTAYAVGEKAADIIVGEWKSK